MHEPYRVAWSSAPTCLKRGKKSRPQDGRVIPGRLPPVSPFPFSTRPSGPELPPGWSRIEADSNLGQKFQLIDFNPESKRSLGSTTLDAFKPGGDDRNSLSFDASPQEVGVLLVVDLLPHFLDGGVIVGRLCHARQVQYQAEVGVAEHPTHLGMPFNLFHLGAGSGCQGVNPGEFLQRKGCHPAGMRPAPDIDGGEDAGVISINELFERLKNILSLFPIKRTRVQDGKNRLPGLGGVMVHLHILSPEDIRRMRKRSPRIGQNLADFVLPTKQD